MERTHLPRHRIDDEARKTRTSKSIWKVTQMKKRLN